MIHLPELSLTEYSRQNKQKLRGKHSHNISENLGHSQSDSPPAARISLARWDVSRKGIIRFKQQRRICSRPLRRCRLRLKKQKKKSPPSRKSYDFGELIVSKKSANLLSKRKTWRDTAKKVESSEYLALALFLARR